MRKVRRRLVAWICLSAVVLSAMPLQADDAAPRRSRTRDLLRRFGGFLSDTNERSHMSVKEAFRDVVRAARQSTVRVLCDGAETALGTIVDQQGHVLTKASEMIGRIECMLHDGRRVEATLVAVDIDHDVALLKLGNLPATELVPVSWSSATPPVGAWLATVGLDSAPAAIGVVSTEPRQIPPSKAALGVHLESTEQGPRITEIVPGSAAANAELRPGDLILRVNGRPMPDWPTLSKTIASFRPGERIQLSVQRGDESLSVHVRLSEWSRLGNNEQAEIMDSLGGPLSERRNGFPLALQHDTVLLPRDCGGPIVDLEGSVVGINIARSSRVATYAIPSSVLNALITKLTSEELARQGHLETLQNTSAVP